MLRDFQSHEIVKYGREPCGMCPTNQVGEQLAASQEWLISMWLVGWLVVPYVVFTLI
jgi:hypothetical protein